MEKIQITKCLFRDGKKTHIGITTHLYKRAHIVSLCISFRPVLLCFDQHRLVGLVGADSCIHHSLIACEFIKINIIIFSTNCFFLLHQHIAWCGSFVCSHRTFFSEFASLYLCSLLVLIFYVPGRCFSMHSFICTIWIHCAI